MVAVFPSRALQNTGALAALRGVPLQGFAVALHSYLLNERNIYPLDYAAAASRPVYNEQVLRAGWRILQDFLHEAAAGGEDVPEIPAEPDLSCFSRVAEERQGENTYEAALHAGLPMRDKNGVPLVWQDDEGRGVWVRCRELLGEIKSRRLDLALPGGERAMLRYFEERYTVYKSRDVRPPSANSYLRAALIEGLIISTHPDEEDIV
jgi:hypothetical protein